MEKGDLLALCRVTGLVLDHEEQEAGRELTRLAERGGITAEEGHEWALMLLLFAGYPASISAAGLLEQAFPDSRELRAEEAETGVFLPRGRELFDAVYGAVADRALESLAARSRTLADWILDHGYGRILSRRGLDGGAREGLSVYLLARAGWRTQLKAHLRGSLRLGLKAQTLEEVLDLAPASEGLKAEAREWLRQLSRPSSAS